MSSITKKSSWLGLLVSGLLLGTTLPVPVGAQTASWKRQLGTSSYDASSGVATDSNGNVYISGTTGGSFAGANQGSYDAWVAKYNNSGNLVWKRQLGTSSYDYSEDVATDSNGNVYISGYTGGSLAGANQGSYDAWVAKYNNSGTLMWKRQLGSSGYDYSFSVATDSNGNVYISGYTDASLAGANHGRVDAWVAKYNNSGNLLWKRQLGSSKVDYSFSVATDSNGNVYISGSTDGSLAGANHGKGDAWVAKYNNSGNLMWKRQLGSSYYDASRGVGTDSNGNVYISGTTNGSLAGAIQGYQDDVWVAKYSNSGNLMWKRQLGSSGSEYFVDVATDSNGNVYISGSTSFPFAGAIQGYQYDAWVAKYNNSGDLMWKRQLEISSDEFSSGVAIDSNGNVYISGNTYDLFGEKVHESWLIKILSN